MNLHKLKINSGDLLSLRHYLNKFYIGIVLDDTNLLIDSKIHKVHFETFKSSRDVKVCDILPYGIMTWRKIKYDL